MAIRQHARDRRDTKQESYLSNRHAPETIRNDNVPASKAWLCEQHAKPWHRVGSLLWTCHQPVEGKIYGGSLFDLGYAGYRLGGGE